MSLTLTIFDGAAAPRIIQLDPKATTSYSFGRAASNDIVLQSGIVSGTHGRITFRSNQWIIEDKACYEAAGSTNGLLLNNTPIKNRIIMPGDLIRINNRQGSIAESVLFYFSEGNISAWNAFPMGTYQSIVIGRDPGANIVLSDASVSQIHAVIQLEQGYFVLYDNKSRNGVSVNGVRVTDKQFLQTKDVIGITSHAIVFSYPNIFYCNLKAAAMAPASQTASAAKASVAQTGAAAKPADSPAKPAVPPAPVKPPVLPKVSGSDADLTKAFDFDAIASNSKAMQPTEMMLTIFDGTSSPSVLRLNPNEKVAYSFGRNADNSIVLRSNVASGEHGRIIFNDGRWTIEDKACYSQKGSTNGILYNNNVIKSRVLCDGDFIRIDQKGETVAEGVLFIVSGKTSDEWSRVPVNANGNIVIGRDASCNIVLQHVSVSKQHAIIRMENGVAYIYDNHSTNGVIVNGVRVNGKQQLHEKDVIAITNSKLIFTSSFIYYRCCRNGISVDANNIVITRGKGSKEFVTGNNVNINIRPGELVAIIGGSGAGKSTILNCMCGYLPPKSGKVYINGIDLYQNFDSLKKLIGYVPQSDIVYDNLTLYDMLSYTAKLRLPKDTSPKEREQAIERAIRLVELTEKKNSYIKALSGGQRKRASIAVELLSDPNLLFLDEPASGLDPGTERNLMHSLREMANKGKTVILVTHSTLQLKLCDKVVFMGKGGNLCFCGSYDEALRFFGVDDVVDVYNMITDHAKEWRGKYDQMIGHQQIKEKPAPKVRSKTSHGLQLGVLISRYLKLVFNDRQRLTLLLAQAPILALLISLVADGNQFEQYEMTKSLMFALSCSAFWVGMLNAIQEICKERTILKREYMTGLSLTAYIMSKIVVLGILCLIQSVLIVGVFAVTVGLPEEGITALPIMEIFLTTLLTAAASVGMGLFVSSLFTNADRAMTVAPILLMPQILFSGLIFKLDGATKLISWLAVCRWSMEGYGTTTNLNSLELRLQQEGIPVPHEAEDFFEFTMSHMAFSWAILALFVVIFLVLARIVLRNISKENG